ncbi:MAG: hypothetical protein QMC22_02945, partial [Pseudomonadales bacterium]
MNEKQSHRSLDWVSQGLDEAVIGARQTLESYLSGSSEPDKLIECRRYLETILASFTDTDFSFAILLTEQLILLIDVIIKDNCVSDENAYQALLGGLLQLPNYLVRLRSVQNNKASDIIAVINDVRAAANVSLMVDQKVFSLRHKINKKITVFKSDSVKSHLQSCQSKFKALNTQAENSRSMLDDLCQAFSELMSDYSAAQKFSEDTVNDSIINAINILTTAASNSSSQLSLAAKYALGSGFFWLEQSGHEQTDIDAEQVLR